VLDRDRVQLSQTVGQLPSTLRTTRTGMVDLQGSLGRLTSTANDLQPTAAALDPLLAKVEPVLVKARPVVADLRGVLVDARPLVRDLVPTADRTAHVLDDLDGTVLDNINGPILNAVNTPWRGVGSYQGNGSKYTLYQDIAYAFTGLGRAFKYVDKDGHVAAIQVGQGIDEVSAFRGLPNFEQFFRGTVGPKESPR
jgi:phospholipid/cholesterol/gamma-HCH transport system substrate-binding protein